MMITAVNKKENKKEKQDELKIFFAFRKPWLPGYVYF